MPSKKVSLKKKPKQAKPAKKAQKKSLTARKPAVKLKTSIAPVLPVAAVEPSAVIPTPTVEQIAATPKAAPQFPQARSPYVIDLKKMQYDRHISEVRSNSATSHFFEQLKEEINAKKSELTDLGKSALNRARPAKPQQPAFHVEMPKETIVQTLILEERKTRNFSLPKFKAPTFTAPKINLPKFALPKLNLPSLNLPNILFTRYARQTVTSFVLASFLMVSPLWAFDTYQRLQEQKEKILSTTTEAIGHLKSSAGQPALDQTQDQLAQAQALFAQAHDELSDVPALVNAIISALPQGRQVKTGEALLELAEKTTKLAENIVGLVSANSDGATVFEKLNAIAPALDKEKLEIDEIKALLKKINSEDVPEKYRAQLESVSTIISHVAENIDTLYEESSLLIKLLGSDGPKRYLLLFQNNNEIRATGGFIGSYATLTIDRGTIKSFIVPPGGSYDLRAGLKANIQAPKPITVMAPRWEFQDANYFADFPQSAQKVLSIYQKSGGTTVDGVMAINATFLGRLLQLSGPLTMENNGMVIDQDNYLKAIQEEVEFGSNKALNKPKEIIGQVIDTIMAKISAQSSALPGLASVIFGALEEKEIQVYLSDPKLQEIVAARRWSGELAETSGDYLNIVSTNISGGKTNLSLSDSVSVKVEIDQHGQIINTVSLTRAHLGGPENALTNEKNNDYLRFYVPLNSELISAEGFEPIPNEAYHPADFPVTNDPDLDLIDSTKTIDEKTATETFMEGGKTVFANWMQVAPGQTKTVTISYKVPLRLTSGETAYSLLIQKQSGKHDQTYSVAISAPQSYDYIWAYPANLRAENHKYTITELPLTKDVIIGIIFQIP